MSTYGSPQLRLCLVSRSLRVNDASQVFKWHVIQQNTNMPKRTHLTSMLPFVRVWCTYLNGDVLRPKCDTNNLRVRKCRFRWVVRVKLAVQWGHSFDFGRTGTLPLCDRIFEAAPSFLNSMFWVDGPAAFSAASDWRKGGLSLTMMVVWRG